MSAVEANPDEIACIAADPCWFPLRYDGRRDAFLFVCLSRDDHRRTGFLKDASLLDGRPLRTVHREALPAIEAAAPLRLIMHSGLTCSTLLARALDQPGAAMALSEPPILTDLVAHRLSGADRITASGLLADVLGLLGRPFRGGEAIVVKMGSVGNALGPDILAAAPDSRLLMLHAPLPIFLAAIARKGLWGRLWGRKLFIGLRNARMVDLGFADGDYFEQTDLQLAACAWLAIHSLLARTGRAIGATRAKAIDSERLTNDFNAGLHAIAAHFELPIDAASIVNGPLFARHAKSGEPFDLKRRAAELDAALAAHRSEIDTVCGWIAQVAEAQRISIDLPHQLILNNRRD